MDPKSILLWFMFKNVQPMFFFRLVIISHLTYRPLTHFEFILIYGIREYSNTNKSKTIDKMTYILIHKCVSACSVCSVMSKSSPLYGLQPTGLLSAWDFPDENTGVVAISRPRDWTCLGLLHCMKILYPWATGKVTYISS